MTEQTVANGNGALAAVGSATPIPAVPIPLAPVPVVTDLREVVTCPACGTVGTVTLNHRDAADFCVKCDYPLFWVPSRIELDATTTADGSLRRLPGTVGRATIASLVCPHCAENNAPSAQVCVRCGRPLRPVAPPPPVPVPVYVAPPEPFDESQPRGVPWWVWLLIGLAVAGVIAAVAIIVHAN